MADAHGPLAMAMCAGLDLIEAACETTFGGMPAQHSGRVALPNSAGIPDRPSGHCPQVPVCERPIRCADGAREPCGWCPPCMVRRDALADARDWQREYASVTELDEAEQRGGR